MAKQKFDMDKLGLPGKPTVLKEEPKTTAPQIDQAVQAIHQVEKPELKRRKKTGQQRRVNFELPAEWFKPIAQLCLDRDITLTKYFLELIEKDLKNKGVIK